MTGTILSVATDAATVEVDAGIAVAAGGCMGEHEAELLAIGGEHDVLALGAGGNGGDKLSRNSLFGLTIGREVTKGAAMKTAIASALAGWLG